MITIELGRDQWDLVLVELDRSNARALRRGDEAVAGYTPCRDVQTWCESQTSRSRSRGWVDEFVAIA